MEVFNSSSDIYQILTEAISEGIVVVNEKQIIVATNQSLNSLFGYKKDELVGKSLNTLIPEKYHHNHSSHFKSFMNESTKRQMGHGRDLYGLKKDGSTFPVEAGLNPFEIYGKRYVMALIIDITVRKEQELEIQELNTELEGKIAERTKALNESILKLQKEVEKRKQAENKIKESLRKERELSDLKTKFLSLVSHEFKTPLSGIFTSATLAGKYTKEEQQEKREKHIKTIQNKVKYLNNILDDFLSIERIESGKVNYKYSNFPISKVINEVIYGANMLLKEGQIINYPEGIDTIVISFDEKILELTLTNLVNNAIKYSSENTTIDIRVTEEGDQLIIEVEDEGMGIPAAEQKHIFNRYFRAENALLNQGTGIGLNIVQNHLENLDGTITFTSEENKGSTFKVTIPTMGNL
ncbi:MAG: PAS domain-containing sensor histidine kinase [Bacteroidia bacterium]|nr:PAS domain-containing sensor histidine kinase [Bacteroidia bacterium]NNF30838.1 PAS domain-containing sensor histidine kinase [Flavobacteriaceae bacterium]MBT8275455.1 PAS domain-containing sensor histidine kinase [Bacteroidia bacterium]NNJ81026.1 PAS domain-containing sensor histidine kinase [Flavobacteriaceae bacterium]NNK54451.1 PAS domain-containing sensor histidine kinase [Flavobacteriaceae bacterium]